MIVGAVLAFIVSVVGVVVLYVVGGPVWLAPIIGILFGALMVWHLVRSAYTRATRQLSTGSVDQITQARYENLAEGLSLSIGLPVPELRVVRDDALNAMVAEGADTQTVAVTDSLLNKLDRIELEAVLAELLVRLKSGDAKEGTTLASVVGSTCLESPLSPILKPLGQWLLGRHLHEHRDMLNDQQAVAVTRYPPGLSAAFNQMAGGSLTPAAATVGTDHLWLATPPRTESVVPSIPLDWRIEVLTEI